MERVGHLELVEHVELMRRAPTPALAGPVEDGRDASSVGLLITLVASAATAGLVLAAHGTWDAVAHRPGATASLVAVSLALQLVSVEVYGKGAVSFAGTGLLAIGFTVGIGPAMATGVLVAAARWLRTQGKLHRAVFDAATLSLAAGGGAAIYAALDGGGHGPLDRVSASLAAALVFWLVNIGLLSSAMGVAEQRRPLEVWVERFRWMTPYALAGGPLALALTLAYGRLGIAGLYAFALPPAFMMLSIRQYLSRTRAAVEEVQSANRQLAVHNEELEELFRLAAGMAARAHDLAVLVAFVEKSLGRLIGSRVRVDLEPGAPGIQLLAGGVSVGALSIAPSTELDGRRWERLGDAIVPQLATALESALLGERVRRVHRDTIAALSRSMEAKDYYTSGHTERVSAMSVALARTLGLAGPDLDAIEIGALLHDIGKIGIPEHILHKTGPLDAEEWRVMREHPVISDYILAEIDLHPFVREIVRWSHERIDGGGYPDRLAGDAIPLSARIVFVADAFDALTTDRPYRPGRHTFAAIAELRDHAGTQFCPLVLDALDALLHTEPELFQQTTLRVVA